MKSYGRESKNTISNIYINRYMHHIVELCDLRDDVEI